MCEFYYIILCVKKWVLKFFRYERVFMRKWGPICGGVSRIDLRRKNEEFLYIGFAQSRIHRNFYSFWKVELIGMHPLVSC